MGGYNKILVVVDLAGGSEQVLGKALELAGFYQAPIRLLHVIEYVPVEPMGEALLPSVTIEDEIAKSAQRRLEELGQRYGVDESCRALRIGNIKSEIVHYARDSGCDLIVLGCRERHGLAILVNFTEDTVLHAAPCDVLAVRLED